MMHSRNPAQYPSDSAEKFALAVYGLYWRDVKEFLECGANSNQLLVHPRTGESGLTALHIACQTMSAALDRKFVFLGKVVKYLLLYGANVKATDTKGNTALHSVAESDSTRVDIIRLIMKFGADIKAKNHNGETPLEVLLRSRPKLREVKYFLDNGLSLNACNMITGKGYIATALISLSADEIISIMEKVDGSLDVSGRNCIQNCIYKEEGFGNNTFVYTSLIGHFMMSGCDINNIDYSGMTALDLAIRFENKHAIRALLECGFEVNCEYYMRISNFLDPVAKTQLMKFDQCMRSLGLHSNSKPLYEIFNDDIPIAYRSEVAAMTINAAKYEKIKVGPLKLHDFLSVAEAEKLYWKCSVDERKEINQFFYKYVFLYEYDVNGQMKEQVLHGKNRDVEKTVLKVQYSKIFHRHDLMQTTSKMFKYAVNHAIPDICVKIILEYLNNSDLKNCIAAATNSN